jgi:TP901 family phage tail tape measure protein
MADDKNTISELWLKVKADIVEFHNGMVKAAAELKTFTSKLGAQSQEMQKFGKAIGAISLGLAAMGGLAVKVFADFEQSMANTFSVLGVTSAEMQKLTDYAREMGAVTVFNASQAADAMYYMASAGYKTDQIMGALKGTLDLAAATQYDLAETTRIVVGTLNAFNLSADQAGRISNLFAASISNSQATMDRIGESMKIAAPLTNSLGTSVEQLTANFGALYNAGVDASTAGTNVRQILTKLLNPTKDAREALAKFGLKVSDVSPQLHTLTEIVGAFEKAGAGAKDKTDELVRIFDLRAVGAMSVLLKTGSEALFDMEREITGTAKASSMAEMQINTLKGSIELFQSEAEEIAITIGQKLVPIIRGFVDFLTGLVTWFNKLNPTVQSLAVAIPAIAAAFGLLISPVALLIGMIPKLVAGYKILTTVLSGATGAALGWVAVIGLLVAAISTLVVSSQESGVATEEAISHMKNYNTAAINQRKVQIGLIDSFIQLKDKTNKTNIEIEQERILFEKIKKQYPDLISSTDDYASATNKLRKASETLNTELEQLYEQQANLRELEIRVETAKLRKDMRELKDDMEDTSLGFWQSIKSGFRLLGDTSGVELEMTRESMDKLAASAQGIKQLKASLELRTTGLEQAEEKLINIRTKLDEIKNDDAKNAAAKEKEIETLKDQEQEQIKIVNVNKDMIDIYTAALDKGAQLLNMDTQIKENQIELNKIRELGAKAFKESEEPEIIIDHEIDEPDTEIQKKLNDLLLKMQKTRLDAELSNLSLNKDKELGIALKYAEAEYKLKKAITSAEKTDALITAKEVNADTKIINTAFKEREKAEENAFLYEITEIKKKFRDKDIKEEWNRISSFDKLNETELNNYKSMLIEKLSTLDKWTDDYKAIVDEIKSINDKLNLPEQQRLRFDIEMSQYSTDEDERTAALENYREYLNSKIALEQEYTDKWYEYVSERARIEKELIDQQTDDLRIYFDEVMNIIDAGLGQAVDQYLIVTRKAKSQMDAIWIAIENAAIRAMTSIIQAEITKMFLKIITKIASYLGTGGIAAGGDALLGDFNLLGNVGGIADTGGVVKKAGNIRVKAQEVIVPGEVVRATRNKYQDALIGDTTIKPIQRVENHTNYYLVNPMVDDQKYWQSVFENKMIPAQETKDKRQGRKK